MSKEQSAEPFLGRWSRRKLEADQPKAPADVADNPPPHESQPAAELTDVDLPSPESLDEDGDYAAFLAPGISDALRQRALKRLFAQPRFNGMDGLDDYADDFTRFPPLGDLVTREMRRMLELEKETSEQDQQDQGEASGSEAPTDDDTAESVDPDETEPGDKMEEG